MIITPKQPGDDGTVSRLSNLVPYMLRGRGEQRCTWYMAGNLEGLDRQEDAELAVDVMELLQKGNVRAKGNKTTYHLVISFHPEDRRPNPPELENVAARRRDLPATSTNLSGYTRGHGARHAPRLLPWADSLM
jgi:hypothetical protein